MSTAIQALNVVLPVIYLVAAVLHGMGFGGPDAPHPARTRRTVTVVALAAHAAIFILHWISSGASPLFDAWTTLSAVAFFLALLFIGTSLRIAGTGAGGVVLLVVAVIQCLASALGPMEARAPAESTPLVSSMHAFTSVAATAALLLSALHGTLYLIVVRRMKKRKFGPIVRRLPNLQVLARLTRRASLAGFLLLAVGVNFGIGWAHYAKTPGFSYRDPWVFAMLILWFYFGAVAFSKYIPGFTAQRASIAAAAGGFVLLVSSILAVLPVASFHWGG